MADDDRLALRAVVDRYRALDDQIRTINRTVAPLREQRGIVELELVDILRQPAYATFEKLDIREDGSSIKINKPGTWHTSPSLTKKKLWEYLQIYFNRPGAHTASDCYKFIHDSMRRDGVQNTFRIERVVRE